jgi:protocatechuate 3,4-dioxygenase beta subunit
MANPKVWFIVVFAAIAAAQTTPRTATVEGVVKNLATGDPITDVRVTLTSENTTTPGARSATTDAEGRFMIEGIAPGRHAIGATRTLFFRPRRNAGPAAVTVAEGERLRGIQILLSPTGVIAGRVVDENRAPLRSVRVEALRRELRDGARMWFTAAQSTTDDRGDYRLFNLQPGTYYVRATQANVTPLYYPGVADSRTAVPVSLAEGNEVSAIDIELRKPPEYLVQFKLSGAAAGSTTNFSARRRNSEINEPQVTRAESLPDSTYRLKLPSGSFDLWVQIATPAGVQPRVLTHAGLIPIEIGNADLDLGTVSVRRTAPVTGRIVVPEPLPSTIAPERLVLTFRALDLPVTMNFTARGGAFGADGSFTLPDVVAGRYQIQLSGLPPDTYLISARAGTRDALDAGYTVSGDQQPLELSIGGPRFVGSVEGSVVNATGQPVSAASVVLAPSLERRGNPAAFRTATTDHLGNFTMRSVLPGDYKLIAWEELEPGIYMDPEFLKSFETRGETIRIQPGSRNAASVRVIPAGN